MTPRLAILPDFAEEGWPSMDLAAEMLLKHLAASDLVQAKRICPPFKKRLSFLGGVGRNVDRLLNRMWNYPRFARRQTSEFDCFHVVDHSYSQIVHALPADRTGVFCHDLDTFRCIVEPEKEPRPRWFRAMARKILAGMRKARVVFYLTGEIRRQIEQFGLIDPQKLIWAPPAAAEEFVWREPSDEQRRIVRQLVGSDDYIMHVGSCIPRKRIDVLLKVFAAVREGRQGDKETRGQGERSEKREARSEKREASSEKEVLFSRDPKGSDFVSQDSGLSTQHFHNPSGSKLLQIGGSFTVQQRELIQKLGLTNAIIQLAGLDRTTLAHLYRGARLVLQPSEAEGFGLPVVEALACGTAVVASDIPVLREVGGDAVYYCPVGDIDAWSHTVFEILNNELAPPDRSARLAQAAKFSWASHARTIAAAYASIASTVQGREEPIRNPQSTISNTGEIP